MCPRLCGLRMYARVKSWVWCSASRHDTRYRRLEKLTYADAFALAVCVRHTRDALEVLVYLRCSKRISLHMRCSKRIRLHGILAQHLSFLVCSCIRALHVPAGTLAIPCLHCREMLACRPPFMRLCLLRVCLYAHTKWQCCLYLSTQTSTHDTQDTWPRMHNAACTKY